MEKENFIKILESEYNNVDLVPDDLTDKEQIMGLLDYAKEHRFAMSLYLSVKIPKDYMEHVLNVIECWDKYIRKYEKYA